MQENFGTMEIGVEGSDTTDTATDLLGQYVVGNQECGMEIDYPS